MTLMDETVLGYQQRITELEEKNERLREALETHHYNDSEGDTVTHKVRLEHTQHTFAESSACPICRASMETKNDRG